MVAVTGYLYKAMYNISTDSATAADFLWLFGKVLRKRKSCSTGGNEHDTTLISRGFGWEKIDLDLSSFLSIIIPLGYSGWDRRCWSPSLSLKKGLVTLDSLWIPGAMGAWMGDRNWPFPLKSLGIRYTYPGSPYVQVIETLPIGSNGSGILDPWIIRYRSFIVRSWTVVHIYVHIWFYIISYILYSYIVILPVVNVNIAI